MTETARRADAVTVVVRRLLPPAVLLALVAWRIGEAAGPLGNTDTYFHLRFGREFLHHWTPWDPGRPSRFGTADWVPTQWLSQLVMARTEAWFGLPGVAWLSGLQVLLLLGTVYVACRRRAEPLAATVVTAVTLLSCAPALSMRPQVLSFVLVTVAVAAWTRAHEHDSVPWWLVPLTWLWAMTHGMWLVGIVIGLVAWAGIGLDLGFRTASSWRRLAVPLLSGLAACLTPVGPALWPAVVSVGSRGEYFSEWATPSFSTPQSWLLLIMLGGTAAALMRAGRAGWYDVATVALSAAFTVYSIRTLPVAALLLAPLAARLLQAALHRGSRRPQARELLAGAAAGVAALALLAALVPSAADEPAAAPDWVDSELSALPDGTGVLSSWAAGGYLMWRFPDLDVLMHGYGDVFTDAELERNVEIGDLEPGWDDRLRATGVEVAVLDPQSPLAYALTRSGWQTVREAEEVELLLAPDDWR